MSRIHKLVSKRLQTGGRNNQGVITVFHRGGGAQRAYRIIDFKRSLFNHPALVKKIEYDPNRTSSIALLSYRNGMLSYILAPKNLNVGDTISAGPNAPIGIGSALPIQNIPIGTMIHNIELKPGKGGQLMRSAGTWAKIIKKDAKNAIIRLHSGRLYSIPSLSMATVGTVSNDSHKNLGKMRKAGQARWRNKRPIVRGVAMNPVDHPHGGGEGRSKGGKHPVSPWGKLTKGKRTSKATTRKRRLQNWAWA